MLLHRNTNDIIYNHQKLILLGPLILCSLIHISNSTPLNNNQTLLQSDQTNLTATSLTSSSKRRTLEDNGNPSELAWQAWLLFDSEENSARSSSDSSNMVRRITPKSIFIAPSLQSCPDGYESDAMGRCVKNVKIDRDAHINFLLQRLNAMYANYGNQKSKPKPTPPPLLEFEFKPQPQLQPQLLPSPSSSSSLSLLSTSISQANGPFQLNIPLIVDTDENDKSKKENVNVDEAKKTFSTFESPLNKNSYSKLMISQDDDTIVSRIYEVNDTKKEKINDEKDEKFFLINNQNTKVDNNDEKSIPIVEFVQESNSNITRIVDYNIPIISISQIENRTELTYENNNSTNKNINNDKILNEHKTLNVPPVSSTLVLLITPPKLLTPNITENLALIQNNEKAVNEMGNNKNDSAIQETVDVYDSQDVVTTISPIENFFDESKSTEEYTCIETTTLTEESDNIDENEETTDYTDEKFEEFDDSTDHIIEDFDISTEGEEEILKHSEAGVSVTIPSLIVPSDDKNMTVNNMSSVVTISDDFVRETTLLGMNIDEPINKSKDSNINNKKTPADSFNDEKIIVITPKSVINPKTTCQPREIILTMNSNKEENTESSTIVEENTSEISVNDFETESIYPSTTQLDDISSTDSDNINPVVTIEEASTSDVTERQSQSSPINHTNNFKSQIITDRSNNSEMMTASSTNVENIILPRDKLQDSSSQVSSLSPFMNEAHGAKYIRAPSTPILERIQDNLSSSTTISNNQQVYNYDTIAQHYPNRHAYGINDNQRIELNKNYNQRPNFFPNNFGTPIDFTRNYVRFPIYKRPQTRPGYVRFPLDEANSIHTPGNLKNKYEHRPYTLSNNEEPRIIEAEESKQSNWRTSPVWRSDRQQFLPLQSRLNTNGQMQRNSSPILMKFWMKMPLIKDPSLLSHPTYPAVIPLDNTKQRNNEQFHSTQMVNFYNQMPVHTQTQTFVRHSATGD